MATRQELELREQRLRLRLKQLELKDACQNDFISYVKYMWEDFVEGSHHKIIGEAFNRIATGECKRLIINMAPRHRLPLTAHIPTTKGWKTMSEIRPGDYVFDPGGRPVLVTGKSDTQSRPIFRATTTDGATLLCSDDHLWTARLASHCPWSTRTAREWWEMEDAAKSRPGVRNNPRLPDHHAWQLPEKELLVDPYILGAWIGDGASASGTMAAHPDDAPHIRARFEERGVPTTDLSTEYIFGTRGLMVRLREIGVLGNKHIPEDYLFASEEQRIQLLQGLMDTDGSVSRTGTCTFHSSCPDLVDQFLSLVQGLGGKARATARHTLTPDGKPAKKSWRVNFRHARAASLPRKARRLPTSWKNKGRTISFEPLGYEEDTQCLEVENEDGLFLAGRGSIVTHNTKSEFASVYLPSWYMGLNPKGKVIQATHTADLAVNFGRQVKNLIDRPEYGQIFEDTKLAVDAKASGKWATSRGGMYFAVGVGANIAGKGADLFIIDDPHSEQTLLSANGFENDMVWYQAGPRQRLQPGAAIVLVMCMTGDTQVLMADGTEKALSELRVGEYVQTYEGGQLSTARVNNWRSSGIDDIYSVQTRSNRVLKANARHPFLVLREGVNQWIRLSGLKVGDLLVSLKAADGPLEQKHDRESAPPAKPLTPITGKTPGLPADLLATTGSGRALNAVAEKRSPLKGCALDVTELNTLPQSGRPRETERLGSNTGTGLPSSSMGKWSRTVETGATVAENPQPEKTLAPTGMENSVSTTATEQGRYGDCSATTATSCSGTGKHLSCSNEGPFTYDEIVSIEASGREEVFDVEIDRTENFIANGVVSHNTRWSKKDLTGQLIKRMQDDPDAEQWEVIELPAIMPSGNACWPEYWTEEALMAVKGAIAPSMWNAQYMQQPTGDDNAIIKREWWQEWEHEDIPELQYVLQSYDTAFSSKENADYSAITTWGVFSPNGGDGRAGIILLDAVKGRWDFPELKREAYKAVKYWDPDTVLIEAKATGTPLTHELRQSGIPVVNFTPARGMDKTSRVHTVAPIFEAGMVYYPADRLFAKEVVEECAAFPYGEHDDYVDTVTQALMRYRTGNFIRLPTDEDDWLEKTRMGASKAAYYG